MDFNTTLNRGDRLLIETWFIEMKKMEDWVLKLNRILYFYHRITTVEMLVKIADYYTEVKKKLIYVVIRHEEKGQEKVDKW